MRIIAGRWRGRRLAAPGGETVRPTGDRAREALFGILERREPRLVGAVFLDVFAGTGAVGLEALSRGAAFAFFVERAPAALAALRRNVEHCGAERLSRILAVDATRPGPASAAADLVFLDPPYGSGLAGAALAALALQGWLAPRAGIVVELAAGEQPELPPELALETTDERRYGAAKLLFLRRQPGT